MRVEDSVGRAEVLVKIFREDRAVKIEIEIERLSMQMIVWK
jgi:hypothetical protein